MPVFTSTMFAPTALSLASDLLLHADPISKHMPGHLYLRNQHSLQVIQLVEGPPPPPRHISSMINDSSASSSASCVYSSDYSGSSCEDEEDEESLCSSYCSSLECDPAHAPHPESSTETHATRMKRILAWRENFSAQLRDQLPESPHPALSPLKRKIELDDNDAVSHCSKRSRSSQVSQADAKSAASLRVHPCPACDASFPTRQSLQRHGSDAKAKEACSAAVEYAFE